MSIKPCIVALDVDPAVVDFLRLAELPVDDLNSAELLLFGCRSKGVLQATVALELFGKCALLRSLAVAPSQRNTGLGAAMVAHAEQAAIEHSVEVIYLLTTTAAEFFERITYVVAERESAPAAIAESQQFSNICPASAVFMRKKLDN